MPEEPIFEVEYIDLQAPTGEFLRIYYELTIGDMVVSSLIVLLLFYLILRSTIKTIWRR